MFDLGAELKKLRIQKGYSQPKLGEKLNKSVTTICRYENNEQTPPIARLYNVSIDYLIGNTDYKAICVDDLSDQQIALLQVAISEFKDKTNPYIDGLTQRQQEIINGFMNEFAKQKK
mgnify:CR=1 FL=1